MIAVLKLDVCFLQSLCMCLTALARVHMKTVFGHLKTN